MYTTKQIIDRYSNNTLFQDAESSEILIDSGPYRRPTRVNDNSYINFDKLLVAENIASNSSLSTHRMLLNIYETDLLFSPRNVKNLDRKSMDIFYGCENIIDGERARPILEKKVFSFLSHDVQAHGPWTGDILLKYFNEYLSQEIKDSNTPFDERTLYQTILNSSDPKRAARYYLIQMASDFLSESSAMARYSLGSYGVFQSNLFNILIDEYGASVHSHKHSTLFEKIMLSVDLKPDVHHYWQFYQASSLALTNYFHYVTKNKSLYFRYIGALFFAESSLVNVTGNQSELFKHIFGNKVEAQYFDEHHHIDRHHGEMVLKRLVEPLLNEFGDEIVPEILQGFEEFRLLQNLADNDLIAQLKWAGNMKGAIEYGQYIYDQIEQGLIDTPLETFVESNGERSTTHTHPDDRLLVIESGEMDFWPIFGEAMKLSAGDVLFVPKHRLHGSVVTSSECIYHQPIAEGLHIPIAAEINSPLLEKAQGVHWDD